MASKGWFFCPYSGALLDIDVQSGQAYCPETGFYRSLTELEDLHIEHKCNMEDYRKRYNLEPLVKAKEEEEMQELMQGGGRSRATVDEDCPKCGHHGLEFYTMQLRSADEGQTVFYECPECKHKWAQNT